MTIGIPLLAHFGLSPRKVAVVGLLGLCAVPWGSMGPGTLIAASMSGFSFHDLGVAIGRDQRRSVRRDRRRRPVNSFLYPVIF